MSKQTRTQARRSSQLVMRCYVAALPGELLSHVFKLAMDDMQPGAETIMFPLRVSAVNHQWRITAHGTPNVWTTIFIYLHRSSRMEERDASFIRLSRNCGLTLKLDFRDPGWNWSENGHVFKAQDMAAVASKLVPYTARWQKLEIMTDTWEPLHKFLTMTRRASAPRLSQIALFRCNEYYCRSEEFLPSNLRAPIALFGGDTPSLRCLVLSGVHVWWKRVKCPRLEELTLDYHAAEVMPSLKEFVDLITGASTLRKLSLKGSGPLFDTDADEWFWNSTGALILPALEELDVGYLTPDYAKLLLSVLETPQLLSFGLHDHSREFDPLDDQRSDELLNYLASSGERASLSKARLDNLTVSAVKASAKAFRGFLATLPAISRISFNAPECEMVLALMPHHHDGGTTEAETSVPCPDLFHLRCEGGALGALDAISTVAAERAARGYPVSVELLHVNLGGEEASVDGSGDSGFWDAVDDLQPST